MMLLALGWKDVTEKLLKVDACWFSVGVQLSTAEKVMLVNNCMHKMVYRYISVDSNIISVGGVGE